jgi:hypothetical protein
MSKWRARCRPIGERSESFGVDLWFEGSARWECPIIGRHGSKGELSPNAQLRSHSTHQLELILFCFACASQNLGVMVES